MATNPRGRKQIKLFFVFTFLLLMTGCWDRAELEDYGFVSAIGIDKGKNNSVNVTYQLTRPRKADEQEKGSDSAEEITVNVDGLFLSRHLVNATVSRKLNFSQVKVLVISKEIAKKKDIIELLESLVRDRQFRRDMFIITTEEKAETFIRANKPKLEKFLYKQYEMIIQTGKETTLFPFVQLQDFVQLSKDNPWVSETILGSRVKNTNLNSSNGTLNTEAGELPSHAENKIQLLGTAIYKKQKMVGKLNANETIISMIMRGKAKQFHQKFQNPESKKEIFGVILRQERPPSYEFHLKRKPYRIMVKVDLEAEIAGIQSEKDYIRSRKGIEKLEEEINRELKTQTEKLVEKSQKELKTDIFHLFEPAKTNVWTNKQWTSLDWDKEYPKAFIKVKYDAHIKRAGRDLGDSYERKEGK